MHRAAHSGCSGCVSPGSTVTLWGVKSLYSLFLSPGQDPRVIRIPPLPWRSAPLAGWGMNKHRGLCSLEPQETLGDMVCKRKEGHVLSQPTAWLCTGEHGSFRIYFPLGQLRAEAGDDELQQRPLQGIPAKPTHSSREQKEEAEPMTRLTQELSHLPALILGGTRQLCQP